MFVRLARLPNSGGISPLNWLEPRRFSCTRLARLPNSGGISPLNWLSVEGQKMQVGEVAQLRRYLPAQLVIVGGSEFVRLARLPNSGGISPLNWFSLRDS